jgi:hypothetical protein
MSINVTMNKIMGAIEDGELSLKEIGSIIKQKKDNVLKRSRTLEQMGCVEMLMRPTGSKGFAAHILVVRLIDRSKFVPVQAKQRMKRSKAIPAEKLRAGYVFTPDPNGTIYKNLDKPERPRPLRKMNYAWQGYRSGLEAA